MTDLTSKEAQEALKARRYYSLSYDIPDTMTDLANRIRTEIRRYALAVHKSGYLLPTENVKDVRDIIKASAIAVNEARSEKGVPQVDVPKIRLLLIDQEELPEILDWARERAEAMVKELTASFEERLASVVSNVEKAIEAKKVEINDKAKEIAGRKRSILRDLAKRVEDADAAFFWFASAHDAKSALKAVRKLIEAERQALKDVSQIGDVPLVQGRLPEAASEAEQALFGK